MDILPNPYHAINSAGQLDGSGTYGPGYSSVSLTSKEPVLKSVTNSSRQERDLAYYHKWEIEIGYNELTCEEFHLIYAFVSYKQCRLEPFFVSIPPYSSQVLSGITLSQPTDERESVAVVNGTGVEQGMVFSITGSPKIYQVTRVETETNYVGISPGSGKERLHFTPGFYIDVAAGSVLTFTDPLFKVLVNGYGLNYSINKDGLFNITLNLQEIII